MIYFLQGCDLPLHGTELKFSALVLLGQHLFHLLQLGFSPGQTVLLIHALLMDLLIAEIRDYKTEIEKKNLGAHVGAVCDLIAPEGQSTGADVQNDVRSQARQHHGFVFFRGGQFGPYNVQFSRQC